MRAIKAINRMDWMLGGLLLLAGCQTAATRQDLVQTRNTLRPIELVSQAADENDGALSKIVPAAASSELMTLTLQGAVATGLVRNPDLVTLRGQEGVSVAVLGVAETYPWNPFVQSQFFPNGKPLNRGSGPGDGSGKSNYYVWVMQRFELAHQQRHREESATAALTQVQWNIQQGELLNIAQTMRFYYAALYQRQLRDLAREAADLNVKLLGVVERRFKANLAMAAEVTTARVAARQTRRQADLAESTYQTALLALRQQLNVPLDTPIELSEKLTDAAWSPVRSLDDSPVVPGPDAMSTKALATQLVEGRPDVMAACAGIMVAQANCQLANAARIPDLQAGPIYDTGDDGTRFLGFRLQMDIPVWNSGAPLACQRHAEMHQQMLTHDQLKERAALEAQMAIDRYERARALAEKSRPEFADFSDPLPAELRDITAQFEAGQADVLAVFLTQNNLILDHRAYLDLLNELAQSAAAVVQATALPPEQLVHRHVPEPLP